jgi:hypothetical protein
MKNVLLTAIFISGITTPAQPRDQQDPLLSNFINHIRAIDNHALPPAGKNSSLVPSCTNLNNPEE